MEQWYLLHVEWWERFLILAEDHVTEILAFYVKSLKHHLLIHFPHKSKSAHKSIETSDQASLIYNKVKL